MAIYEDLKLKIEEIIDPGFNQTLGAVNGIKRLEITEDQIVYVDLYLKDKTKHGQEIKLKVVRLVKIDFGFPGIKIDFFDSNYLAPGQKEIQYLAIASGKGGVGKSTVTANLAYALTQLGKTVGIIDADIYGASIPYILDIKIAPLSTTEDELMIPHQKFGIEVVSTEFFMPSDKPLMWRGPMLGKMLSHYFNGVKWNENTDIVLIDLPPGTGDVALDVKTLVPKSKVLVVTTPNINASHVAVKAGLGAIQIGHEVIGIIENMSYYFNLASQTRDFIFGEGGGLLVAEKLATDILAQIPIGQPLDDKSLYDETEMAGKMYLIAAKKIIDKLER